VPGRRLRKTVRKYIERGFEPPLVISLAAAPDQDRAVRAISARVGRRVSRNSAPRKLLRKIRELGNTGGYTRVKGALRKIWPAAPSGIENVFETPPNRQG